MLGRKNHLKLFILLLLLLDYGCDYNQNPFPCSGNPYFCCSKSACVSIGGIVNEKVLVALEYWENTGSEIITWMEGNEKLGSGKITLALLPEAEHQIEVVDGNGDILDEIIIQVKSHRDFFYYSDGGTIPIFLVTDEIKFAFSETNGLYRWEDYSIQDIYSEELNRFNLPERVEFISFHFEKKNGDLYIPTDGLRCKFKPKVSQEWINKYNKINQVELIKDILTDPSENRFHIKIKHKTNLATLFTANRYYEDENTEYSVPDGWDESIKFE